MKPLCKIHSHFLWLSVLRVVRFHDPVILPLVLGAAHPITFLQTAPDSCCLAQFFSISPICQYELQSCAAGPIVAVKMIYYIQWVSYQVTCRETAHIACQWNVGCVQRLSLQWDQKEAGRRTEEVWGSCLYRLWSLCSVAITLLPTPTAHDQINSVPFWLTAESPVLPDPTK